MYSNHTPNYNLPQYVATDRFDPMADFNPAFNEIDKQMALNADGVAQLPGITQQITGIKNDIAQLGVDIQTNANNIIIAKNAADNAMARAKKATPQLGVKLLPQVPLVVSYQRIGVGDPFPWNPTQAAPYAVAAAHFTAPERLFQIYGDISPSRFIFTGSEQSQLLIDYAIVIKTDQSLTYNTVFRGWEQYKYGEQTHELNSMISYLVNGDAWIFERGYDMDRKTWLDVSPTPGNGNVYMILWEEPVTG